MHKLIEQLERLRQTAAQRLVISVALGIVIGIVAAGITGNLLPANSMEPGSHFKVAASIGALFGVLTGTVLTARWAQPAKREYVTRFKEDVVRGVLDGLLDIQSFAHNSYLSSEEIKAAYLVPIGNRYRGDDLLSASYRGVHFRQCDLYIQHVQNSGKNSTTHTYFHGKWIVLDYTPKELQGYIQVRERESGSRRVSGGIFSSMPEVESVKLESVEFNRRFEVRATHPHSVFYLLTPHFMETVERLCQKVEGQIGLAFEKGRLHIAVHNNQNALEPPLFSPISQDIEQQLLQQTEIITDIIDVLILGGK